MNCRMRPRAEPPHRYCATRVLHTRPAFQAWGTSQSDASRPIGIHHQHLSIPRLYHPWRTPYSFGPSRAHGGTTQHTPIPAENTSRQSDCSSFISTPLFLTLARSSLPAVIAGALGWHGCKIYIDIRFVYLPSNNVQPTFVDSLLLDTPAIAPFIGD